MNEPLRMPHGNRLARGRPGPKKPPDEDGHGEEQGSLHAMETISVKRDPVVLSQSLGRKAAKSAEQIHPGAAAERKIRRPVERASRATRARRGAAETTKYASSPQPSSGGKGVGASLRINSSPSPRPRVRFAPSPTGSLHVGGARTALYTFSLPAARRARSSCASRTRTSSDPYTGARRRPVGGAALENPAANYGRTVIVPFMPRSS